MLYCGNCSKWYVSWFPLTEVKTIWGRRPEWWIRIFHRKPYELVTQDMHTCDLCGRWCSSPVYSIGLIYGGQAKTFTEVCADCMWRLKFSPVRTISLDAYRLFEQWRLSQSEADE